MATPTTSDIFSRLMVKRFDDRIDVELPSAGQSIFGRGQGLTVVTPDIDIFEIDIIRGNLLTSQLQQRGVTGRTLTGQSDMKEQRFTNIARTFPLSKEKINIGAGQLTHRIAGDPAYVVKSRIERLRTLVMDGLTEGVRRMTRMMERLAWQSLRTGVQDAGLLGTSDTTLQFDWLRLSTHTFSPSTKWDNSGDILGDIDTACELVRKDSNLHPDVAIMGGLAMKEFIEDTTVQTLADTRRFELIQVSQNFPVPPELAFLSQNGLIPMGRLRTPRGHQLWVFTYLDGYESSVGTHVKFMPEDEMLIFSSKARADRYFGGPESLPQIPMRDQMFQQLFGFGPGLDFPRPEGTKALPGNDILRPEFFFFDAYADEAWSVVTARIEVAPVFYPVSTDAFVLINDVLT